MKWYSTGNPEERKRLLNQILMAGSGKPAGQHVFEMYCNRMSTKELKEWMTKEEGLRVLLEKHKDNPDKKRQLHKAISEKVLVRALTKWQQAVAEARELAKEMNVGEEAIIQYAENICIQEHYAPFYWKDFLDCPQCGPVLVKDNREPCPWCVVGGMNKYSKTIKDTNDGTERHKDGDDEVLRNEPGGGQQPTVGSLHRDGQSSGSDAGGRPRKFKGLPSMAGRHGS